VTEREGWARGDVACALALVLVKVVASCSVLAAGFTHISDDDYSRTVIAQTFAHAPRLDPSGTSWLPLPFWVTGAAMAVFGRTLFVSRVVAVVLAALASVAPYAGLRAMGVARWIALLGALVASASPLSVFLGAATVPEGFTGLVLAGSIFALASTSRRAWAFGAVGLLVVCLSRYEPWPVALAAGAVLAWRAVRERRVVVGALAGLAVVGPIAWLVWNAHAHHDALHFFARVSTFRRGHDAVSLGARLFGYPKALITVFPEALIALLAGLFALREPVFRRSWALPVVLVLVSLFALVAGDVRDGAPTHHPERALVAIAALMTAFGVHGVSTWAKGRARVVLGAASAAWVLVATWRAADVPGEGPSEDRSVQIARGESLRGMNAEVEVVPCAYEHFAFIAGYGAPEHVMVLPSDGRPVTEICPTVRAALPDALRRE
jgi:hypothetical protein